MAATVCAYANDPVTGLRRQPAPVKLSAFQAIQKKRYQDVLTWTTEQEINASHFVVERSYDGKTFTETGLVFTFDNSIGSNAYRFTDDLRKKHHAVVYYRLRMVDTDGKTETFCGGIFFPWASENRHVNEKRSGIHLCKSAQQDLHAAYFEIEIIQFNFL